MSKYVLLSDIHGNYPALKQVVDTEGKHSEYMVLGDIMGLNGYPKETLELVQKLRGFTLAGNHDKSLFHHGEGHVNSEELSEFEFHHTLDNLTVKQIRWMKELPFLEVVQRDARICLTHAMPWPEKASGYETGNAGIPKRNVPHFASIVADDYDWVFHGHTHEQYNLDASRWGHDVHFVNPGSLGYDHSYTVVDVDSGDVSHRKVEVEADVQGHVQSLLPENAPHTREWF